MKREVDDYRHLILQALLSVTDKDGNARLTEKQAINLLHKLSDDELADGMPFNTPEEVAERLLE